MPQATLSQLLDTAVFAAVQHQYQRRGGYDKLPYVNHLLKVAQALCSIAGETDEALLLAAVLHDIIEDTPVDEAELAERYGSEVASIVTELTDDMSLPLEARKQLQVERAPQLSLKARKIRLADKAANLRDIFTYPLDWPLEKKSDYLRNARAVANLIMGDNAKLDAWFEETAAWAEQQIVNDTRS